MKQAAPIGTLADHAGRYRIWLHCRCGHAKRFEAGDLAQRLGAEFPNRLLVERCRCETCGARGGSMTLEPVGASCYEGFQLPRGQLNSTPDPCGVVQGVESGDRP